MRTISVLIVSAFVVVLNETTMNVALREIMTDLHVHETVAQWLATAFLLTMAVVIPITGWLLQRLTTRQLYLGAMSCFAAGTLLAALAPAFPVLLLARIVQAGGTAVMTPLLMTTIMELVPERLRGRIMGNITLVIAVAPAIGPALAGFVLSFASWRWVFLAVLPIALLMLALGARFLANVGERQAARLDALSVPLAALGFGGTVYALTLFGGEGGAEHAGQGAAGRLLTALPVLAGALGLLALFCWRQIVLQRRDGALLDLRTFRSRDFRTGVVILTVAMLVLLGTVIIVPLVLQGAMGMDPLQVGLMMLPGGIMMGLAGNIAGRLYDRLGARPIVVAGALAVGASYLVYALASVATPWWVFMLAHMCMSLGLAGIFTPVFAATLGSLPAERYAHGSAMLGTLQQLGGAAGTALFVTIMVLFGGSAAGGGASPEQIISGARAAFIAGGAVWLIAIGFALRLPGRARPAA